MASEKDIKDYKNKEAGFLIPVWSIDGENGLLALRGAEDLLTYGQAKMMPDYLLKKARATKGIALSRLGRKEEAFLELWRAFAECKYYNTNTWKECIDDDGNYQVGSFHDWIFTAVVEMAAIQLSMKINCELYENAPDVAELIESGFGLMANNDIKPHIEARDIIRLHFMRAKSDKSYAAVGHALVAHDLASNAFYNPKGESKADEALRCEVEDYAEKAHDVYRELLGKKRQDVIDEVAKEYLAQKKDRGSEPKTMEKKEEPRPLMYRMGEWLRTHPFVEAVLYGIFAVFIASFVVLLGVISVAAVIHWILS